MKRRGKKLIADSDSDSEQEDDDDDKEDAKESKLSTSKHSGKKLIADSGDEYYDEVDLDKLKSNHGEKLLIADTETQGIIILQNVPIYMFMCIPIVLCM